MNKIFLLHKGLPPFFILVKLDNQQIKNL